jgi:hypothetical protein
LRWRFEFRSGRKLDRSCVVARSPSRCRQRVEHGDREHQDDGLDRHGRASPGTRTSGIVMLLTGGAARATHPSRDWCGSRTGGSIGTDSNRPAAWRVAQAAGMKCSK